MSELLEQTDDQKPFERTMGSSFTTGPVVAQAIYVGTSHIATACGLGLRVKGWSST